MTGIRCDANSIIASGHMMRCLTIAKELVKLGESVIFFMADDDSKKLFDGYVEKELCGNGGDDDSSASPVIVPVVLGTDWQDMETELEVLARELEVRKINCLLVDSYRVTFYYFDKLKEICRVAYLDDLNEMAYPVDILINYSGYYKRLCYEESYRGMKGHDGKETRLLLGLLYAPLREQFRKDGEQEESCPDRDRERFCRDGGSEKDSKLRAQQSTEESASLTVLLTSGGADMKGMLLSTLKKAEERGLIGFKMEAEANVSKILSIHWQVVVGGLVKDAHDIDEFAESHAGVTIHRAVTDMAGLMRKCDVAICAAGTMLTECAAVGLPAIYYQVADNQKYNVDYWQSTGGMIFAGDVSDSDSMEGLLSGDSSLGSRKGSNPDGFSASHRIDAVTTAICDAIEEILAGSRLASMRDHLEGITDARGARRIAEALLGANG